MAIVMAMKMAATVMAIAAMAKAIVMAMTMAAMVNQRRLATTCGLLVSPPPLVVVPDYNHFLSHVWELVPDIDGKIK